jgi:N-carbamoylputrescine amidase
MRIVKVAALQMSMSTEVGANIATAERLVRSAAKQGAQIILIPELFEGHYFCKDQTTEDLNRAIEMSSHPTVEHFAKVAKELSVVLPISVYERANNSLFNSVAIVDADGKVLGTYRKSHIPDGPGYNEKFYFSPGDTGFKVWQTKYAKIGVGICWDQWFPEAARLTALSGAQFIFYPTAIGYQDEDAHVSKQQISAWETIQKSHAISNGVFLGSVNRVGRENALNFWGRSFVCNPFGSVIEQADNEPQIIIAQCALPEIESVRQNWPFLRDRRVDAYQGITKLYIDADE